MNKLAPIVIFTYNRPDKLKVLISSLQNNSLASQSDLYIYSDGPKPDSISKVNLVREYIHTIEGFKSINIIESSTNKGLATSIIQGVTDIVNTYGRIIVLEDDLIVNNQFLSYMNYALTKYENMENVYSVSGYSFLSKGCYPDFPEYYFLPIICSWGWATWKNKWSVFDPNAIGYKQLKTNSVLREEFNYKYFYSDMLIWQMEQKKIPGRIKILLHKKYKQDSWAIRWYWSVFTHHGLTLYPKETLIENDGFDGSGTHCGISKGGSKINFNITNPYTSMPDSVYLNQEVCKAVKEEIKH